MKYFKLINSNPVEVQEYIFNSIQDEYYETLGLNQGDTTKLPDGSEIIIACSSAQAEMYFKKYIKEEEEEEEDGLLFRIKIETMVGENISPKGGEIKSYFLTPEEIKNLKKQKNKPKVSMPW